MDDERRAQTTIVFEPPPGGRRGDLSGVRPAGALSIPNGNALKPNGGLFAFALPGIALGDLAILVAATSQAE